MGQGPRPREGAVERRKARKAKLLEAVRESRGDEKVVTQTLEDKRVIPEEERMTEEELERMATSDEFAALFAPGAGDPRPLVTTSPGAHLEAHKFGRALADLFPNAEYRERPRRSLHCDVVSGASAAGFSHLITIGESRKELRTLSVVRLPVGPTAVFRLTNIRLGEEIKGHGRSNGHVPELIMRGFETRLGHRLGRMLISMFPQSPEFVGRQAVTFHCQRDFIFVRRHRYIFEEGGQRARLQEIGPRFTMKLHALHRTASDLRSEAPEYVWNASHARAQFSM
jgi:ribosome production factor 1